MFSCRLLVRFNLIFDSELQVYSTVIMVSQELERGTHCRPVSPPHHLCPHFGDSWRHFFSSNNCVNNTNYCVVVLKCLALSTMLILANWTELKKRVPQGKTYKNVMTLLHSSPTEWVIKLYHCWSAITHWLTSINNRYLSQGDHSPDTNKFPDFPSSGIVFQTI